MDDMKATLPGPAGPGSARLPDSPPEPSERYDVAGMSTSPGPPAQLWNRDFVLLWQGQFVSRLGDQAFLIALMFWTLETTASTTLMGVLMTAGTLPLVLLGPFAGTFADRSPRVAILVGSDLGRGLVMLGLGAAFHYVPSAWLFVLLFWSTLANGALTALFRPTLNATVPDLVPDKRLAASNAVLDTSQQVSLLLGQALGGVLYRLLGPALLFVANGVTFLLSGASESFIRLPRDAARRPRAAHGYGAFMRETRAGLHYVWTARGLRWFVLASSVFNFLVVPVVLLLPVLVSNYLHGGAVWYGFLLATASAGAAVGSLLAGLPLLTARLRARVVLALLFALALLMAVLGFVRTPTAAIAVLLLIGLTSAAFNVLELTLLQRTTPDEIRGRVLGLLATISAALMPAGMLFGGIIGDIANQNVPAIYLGCGISAMVVALALSCYKPSRDFLSS